MVKILLDEVVYWKYIVSLSKYVALQMQIVYFMTLKEGNYKVSTCN